jgi:hypothetical protein
MGFRRRTRRRALIAGAAVGAAAAHSGSQQQDDTEPAPADYQDEAQPAPPPVDAADEIEHLAALHESGALTDEEFAAAKAKYI